MAGADDDGAAVAYLCMTAIGIGYLFPISAIWAAFDYWKTLFPDANIEFVVTGVYQVGSVLTVAVLSLGKSYSMGPRILGGFAGQFLCLALILAFRWMPMPAAELYNILLGVVALCSIATGYLDSALLALCSQYSPQMQRYLQIGIGLGTLVSVMYRDATKLLMPGNIADGTSAYFVVALVTVVICIFCYRLLMRLPCSKHLDESCIPGRDLTTPLLTPPRSPVYAATFSPISPTNCAASGIAQISLDADNAGAGADSAVEPAKVAKPGFRDTLRHVGANQLTIFLNLFLTTLCYPGMITSIPCRQLTFLRGEQWFQTLLLTSFTLADIVARFLTHMRCGLSHRTIHFTVLVRFILFPVVIFCVRSSDVSDYVSFVAVAAFGFLNGYCVSLSLIVVNEIPHLSDEQRKVSGRISACSINSGLCMGSVAAAGLAAVLGIDSQ